MALPPGSAPPGSAPPAPEPELGFDLRDAVQRIAADRHAPEAKALFEVVCRYAHRRVTTVSRRCGNVLSESEQEEVVGDVLFQLMQGSLVTFRGETIAELYAFVRTICDRRVWRVVRRKDRERALLEHDPDVIEDWSVDLPQPDAYLEVRARTPLPEADRAYLVQLLRAGSKAEFARQTGVSRAAVTQRVHRIQGRVRELSGGERATHEAWLVQTARAVTRETEPL